MMNTKIFKLSHELNQAYTYQILLDLIMQFSLILNTFYNMYFYLISTSLSKILDKRFIAFFIWVFIHSTRIILVNNHCTNFYREVEVTAHLLRKLQFRYLDNSIRDEIQQFSLQLLLHPLKFTAGDYFILNNKLSTMFFGNLITYLIILVQISPSNMIKPLS
ncbi:putative gustatory receptor 28b [Apis florea]|uniref:putative gustatory receptor 28b n=1 Tax=Apis florea TaxID=7463 RepID=UPI0012FE90D6|nr:putative gustatory receptor 28b [Apis florea]